jgi:hypothetical protein
MKKLTLSAAIALALTSHNPAVADSVADRLTQLEAQNRAQDAALQQQAETITAQQAKLAAGNGDEWWQHIEINGLIEVEAGYFAPESGGSTSDVTLATVELGVKSKVNAWVEAGVSLLYEQDATDLEIDTGYVTFANAEVTPLAVTAGQIYVPFGVFETNLVSDPLTLELGETRETALHIGMEKGDFAGALYLFNGETTIDGDDQLNHWGAQFGYAHTTPERSWAANVGYLNDLGETDGLQGVVGDRAERSGGWTASASATFGRFNVITEYLTAADDFAADSLSFKDQGAQPAAWTLEAGLSFAVLGKKSAASIGYQGTREALALELPEQRWLLGWSVEVFEHTALKLEWARSTEYGRADGGTGDTDDSVSAQVAVEF